MEEDISRNTIMILVVLTLVISMLGTLSVMSAVNNVNYRGTSSTSSPTQGEVSLTVVDGPQQSGPSSATGQVVLEITESEEKKQPRILLLPE